MHQTLQKTPTFWLVRFRPRRAASGHWRGRVLWVGGEEFWNKIQMDGTSYGIVLRNVGAGRWKKKQTKRSTVSSVLNT